MMNFETPTYKANEILEYLRKSRSDDPALTVDEVLKKHEVILSEWVERNIGSPIPEENIFREVVSGETIDDRPEVLKLLKRIESPKIRAILVVEVQRLSRGDLEDAGRLIKLLRYTNTAVITPQKIYDLNNEYDRDFFERELKRGNEFLEYQKKIMNRGRLLSVSQGNFIGSIPPYGYDKTFVMDGKRKCPTLKINEDEANVVRMIFDMYVNQDLGRVTIANRLNELGIKPRKSARWEQPSIKDILENVHYIGKVRWNWRKTVSVVEDGEIQKTRPKNKIGEYLIYDGKHPAIIPEDLFDAALKKCGKNARLKPNTKLINPFAGLIYCQCGRAMSLRTYTKKGKACSAPRLLCNAQTFCGTGSCTFDEMVKLVSKILQDCICDFEVKIKNNEEGSFSLHQKQIEHLEHRLQELNRKEINQWEKYSEEAMPKHIFEMLNRKVLREKAEVQKALDNARSTLPPDINSYEEKLQRFTDALDTLNDPNVSATRKNKLLKACINKITYSRERAVRLVGVNHSKGIGTPYSNTDIHLDVDLHL